MAEKRIVIIGAGPTGLGAAWRLQELGYSNWAIYEKNSYVGGLAASFIDEKGFGSKTVDDLDFALKGLFDFMLPSRHLFASFQTDQGDFLGPLAFGGQGDIDGHITAPDHEDLFADFNLFTQGGIS